MANSVLVVAESGAGKSSAGRNLEPKETFWINVANKPLPFKGWKSHYKMITKEEPTNGNMSKAKTAQGISYILGIIDKEMPHIKTVVIDDFQFMSSFQFFDKIGEKGFEKFNQIGTDIATVARKPMEMRDDLTIIFMNHAEDSMDMNGKRRLKAKTIGKVVDNVLTLEGLFSVVLYAKVLQKKDEISYVLQTNKSKDDNANTCKSPMGMFEETYIDNDLQIVLDKIKEYEQ